MSNGRTGNLPRGLPEGTNIVDHDVLVFQQAQDNFVKKIKLSNLRTSLAVGAPAPYPVITSYAELTAIPSPVQGNMVRMLDPEMDGWFVFYLNDQLPPNIEETNSPEGFTTFSPDDGTPGKWMRQGDDGPKPLRANALWRDDLWNYTYYEGSYNDFYVATIVDQSNPPPGIAELSAPDRYGFTAFGELAWGRGYGFYLIDLPSQVQLALGSSKVIFNRSGQGSSVLVPYNHPIVVFGCEVFGGFLEVPKSINSQVAGAAPDYDLTNTPTAMVEPYYSAKFNRMLISADHVGMSAVSLARVAYAVFDRCVLYAKNALFNRPSHSGEVVLALDNCYVYLPNDPAVPTNDKSLFRITGAGRTHISADGLVFDYARGNDPSTNPFIDLSGITSGMSGCLTIRGSELAPHAPPGARDYSAFIAVEPTIPNPDYAFPIVFESCTFCFVNFSHVDSANMPDVSFKNCTFLSPTVVDITCSVMENCRFLNGVTGSVNVLHRATNVVVPAGVSLTVPTP